MKKECSIVRDLLPLYAEDMVSVDTGEFVKTHLEGCPECREEYNAMKQPKTEEERKREENNREETDGRADAAPLVALKRKLWKQKIRMMLCTALFVAALLVSAFAVLSVPVYMPYEEELFTVTEHEDGNITIVFDESVTDYSCQPDYFFAWEGEEPRLCYWIEAWTSIWGQHFSKRGGQSVTIRKEGAEEFCVYYSPNDGTEDRCIYGKELIENGGVATLRRLVLKFYFSLALLCIAVLSVVWCIVRKKPRGKAVVECILYYPVSYCVGHLLVKGWQFASYSAARDVMMILFLSIVIYGGVLLARSIYRERKEIKALTERK